MLPISRYLFFLLNGLILSIPSGPLFSQATRVDWIALQAAYAHFAKEPSDDNAQNVILLLPTRRDSEETKTKTPAEKAAEDFILGNFSKLEWQVFQGKRGSVKLAFRFFAIADGDFARDLDILLGKLICRNPRIFLQELKMNHEMVRPLDDLLMDYGPDFTHDEKAQASEKERRMNALRKVHDLELREIRDECLGAMEENL